MNKPMDDSVTLEALAGLMRMAEEDRMALGRRIKTLLEERKVTQKRVAEGFKARKLMPNTQSNVSTFFKGDYVKGRSYYDWAWGHFKVIAELLGMTPAELLAILKELPASL